MLTRFLIIIVSNLLKLSWHDLLLVVKVGGVALLLLECLIWRQPLRWRSSRLLQHLPQSRRIPRQRMRRVCRSRMHHFVNLFNRETCVLIAETLAWRRNFRIKVFVKFVVVIITREIEVFSASFIVLVAVAAYTLVSGLARRLSQLKRRRILADQIILEFLLASLGWFRI